MVVLLPHWLGQPYVLQNNSMVDSSSLYQSLYSSFVQQITVVITALILLRNYSKFQVQMRSFLLHSFDYKNYLLIFVDLLSYKIPITDNQSKASLRL